MESALAAMNRQDWASLRTFLHPYIHWTTAKGGRLRGRVTVLTMLAAGDIPGIPSDYEIRDGQVYRWTEPQR